MKIVITHTDFRLYWPARIAALGRSLQTRGDELFPIEIAGMGSPYAFSGNAQIMSVPAGKTPTPTEQLRNWICLFPTTRMEDIPPALAYSALVNALNELSPDLILCGSIAFPSGAAAVYWAKKNRKAVVMFDDVKPEAVPRGRLVNFIKQRIYDQVDAVLCPAEPWIKALARWNFLPEQLFFGVDTVDNDFWAAKPLSQNGDRPSLPSTYLLAIGRQIPIKNLLFLLQVYAAYRDKIGQHSALPLVLIGNGPERTALEDFARDHKLEQVYFLPFADEQRLRVFYQEAAALVLPSRQETWGLVVNEAMAAGLPVLVSDQCGCTSVLVEPGVNGFTFSPDHPEDLLKALVSFTHLSPEEKTAMSKSSQAIIRSWGLERFVSGSVAAIAYAIRNKKKVRSMTTRFILKSWKGRYRPL